MNKLSFEYSKEVEKAISIRRKNGPEVAKEVNELILEAKAGANRWTDNMYAIKSYLVKKHGISRRDAAEQLGMKENFDYVE